MNLIKPGGNYGWPTYSYGRDYDGKEISALPVVAGIEKPLLLWQPSIAPSGLLFYEGSKFPAWKGNLFIGSARRGEINGTAGWSAWCSTTSSANCGASGCSPSWESACAMSSKGRTEISIF